MPQLEHDELFLQNNVKNLEEIKIEDEKAKEKKAENIRDSVKITIKSPINKDKNASFDKPNSTVRGNHVFFGSDTASLRNELSEVNRGVSQDEKVQYSSAFVNNESYIDDHIAQFKQTAEKGEDKVPNRPQEQS